MTLYGIHVNAFTADVRGTMGRGRPGLVKTLDFGPDWATLKTEYGIRFLLGRVWCDDDSVLAPTPEAAAERLWKRCWEKVQRHAFAIDALETPWNEAHQRGAELEQHARACRRFCELAHGEGLRVAVGNFSVGNPEPDEFAASFGPAMEAADYLSLHEYWLPGQFNAPWWAGRWRRLLDALPASLRRPVIISEMGIDGGLEGRPASTAGWRAYDLTAREYTAELRAYTDALDGDVLGVALFNVGDYPGGRWGSFEAAGVAEVEAWLRDGPADWTPGGEAVAFNANPNNYLVGGGVVQLAASLGWCILSDETYSNPVPNRDEPGKRTANSQTLCDKGVIVWHDAIGVKPFPFA